MTAILRLLKVRLYALCITYSILNLNAEKKNTFKKKWFL